MTAEDDEVAAGEVVQLDAHRPAATFDACPACGSVWWNAAVVFEASEVTSYSDVRCRDCGAARHG